MVSASSLTKQQLAELTPKLRQMLAGAKSKVDAKGGLQKGGDRGTRASPATREIRYPAAGAGHLRRWQHPPRAHDLFLDNGIWKSQL